MKLELVKTIDGSNSLKNLIINDSYHSKYGAINESKHIFINNGLKRISKKKIRVLEIGFGTRSLIGSTPNLSSSKYI